MERGEVRRLVEKYKLEESECFEEPVEGGDTIGVSEISGLFIITVAMIGIAMIHGCVRCMLRQVERAKKQEQASY